MIVFKIQKSSHLFYNQTDQILMKAILELKTIFSIFILCSCAYGASAPIVWTSSNYFQTGTQSFVGTFAGAISEIVTVMYANPLTAAADRRVALGIVDLDQIAGQILDIALVNIVQAQAGFQVRITSDIGINVQNVRFCYMVVDPSFPYPFSVNYFAGSSAAGMVGPFENNYYVNFTASTGVTMDMSHNNGMIAMQHIIDATSTTQCFQMQIQFFMANQSFYQVTLKTTCQMTVFYWGFSRFIFDKTGIESLGFCFFEYGTIQAYNSDDSNLTVTFQNFMATNYIFGLNSYSFETQPTFTFDSVLAATTTVSTTMAFKHLKFMYWAFRYRTCLATYPYFNFDTMLCYDACDARYYQNEPDKLCQPCYYTCYTCSAAAPAEACDSCNSTTDFRFLNGTSCEPLNGYFDNSTTIAAPCSSGCLTCTDQNNCQVCDSGLVLTNGTCLCIPVDIKNCGTCSNPVTCLHCNEGFSLVSGVCESCSQLNCKTCTNKYICTDCLAGYLYSNGKCECIPVDSNCQTCIYPSFCTQCKTGLGANQTGQCINCIDNNCLTCSTPDYSTSCKPNKYLFKGICYATCPQKTKLVQNKCEYCGDNCQQQQEQETQQEDNLRPVGSEKQNSDFELLGIVWGVFGGLLYAIGCCCCCKGYLKLGVKQQINYEQTEVQHLKTKRNKKQRSFMQ